MVSEYVVVIFEHHPYLMSVSLTMVHVVVGVSKTTYQEQTATTSRNIWFNVIFDSKSILVPINVCPKVYRVLTPDFIWCENVSLNTYVVVCNTSTKYINQFADRCRSYTFNNHYRVNTVALNRSLTHFKCTDARTWRDAQQKPKVGKWKYFWKMNCVSTELTERTERWSAANLMHAIEEWMWNVRVRYQRTNYVHRAQSIYMESVLGFFFDDCRVYVQRTVYTLLCYRQHRILCRFFFHFPMKFRIVNRITTDWL